MSSFGARLKHERESRGVTLREISAATNVGLHLLEALETNDFKSLPGGPFNKGFVRAYARHLGIDAEAAVDAYGREEKAMGLLTPDAHRQEPEGEVKLFEMRREGERTTMILDLVLLNRILMGAGLLFVLLLGAWLLWPSSGAGDPAAGPPAEPDSVPSQSTPEGLPSGSPAPVTSPPVQTANREDSSSPASGLPPAQARQTPAQDAEPEAAAATDSPLTITDFGVGTGVSNRMLTGRGDRFTVGTQVWFWTRTLGGTSGDILTHVWTHEDGQTISYDRTLGGAHWRNSSRKSLISTSVGRWVVEARDSSGRVLARTTFRCVSS